MGLVTEINGQKLDVDWGLLELDRLDCEDSLYTFIQKAWKFIDPAPFQGGWAIEAICEHLEAVCDGEIKRLLINIPPRMSKSSVTSVAFPAWVWAQRHASPTSGPRVPFLHASYGYNLSLRDSVKCRRLIKSTWYRKLWGERFEIVKEQDQKVRFRNSVDGERLITSIGSGVTGEGGNIIIVDDPNAADEALSDAITKTTNEEWWDGTMGTRLNDPKTGAFIVVQQRLGEEDLSGHIMAADLEHNEWTKLILPMHYDPERAVDLYPTSIGWTDPRTEKDELLCPDRFGAKEVEVLERRLGSWRAAGQLEQRPEPVGGGIIKRKDWQLWPPEGEPKDKSGKILKLADYPPIDFVLASLDTAYTEKTFNDPSAMTVWGIFSGDPVAQDVHVTPQDTMRVYGRMAPRVMLMDAWAEHLDFRGLLLKVAQTCARWKIDKLVIENKAAGHSIGQEIRRLMTEGTIQDPAMVDLFKRTYAIQLIDPKAIDKIARLYSVQHIFEDQMVFAPERPWSELVIDQCVIEGTLIVTSEGVKRVEDVWPGDLVLTHKGRFMPVLRTATRKVADIVVLRGKALDPLVLTAEHPVYAARLSSLREVQNVGWTQAGDMKPREYRVVIRDGKEVEEAYPSACDAVCLPVPRRAALLDEIDFRDWCLIDKDREHELLEDADSVSTTHAASKWIRWRQPLDKAFGRICGLYMAEGSYSRRKATWSFNACTEQGFIDEVQLFIRDRFGCGSSVWTGNGASTVVASLSLIEPFFRSFGSDAVNKRVPEWMWDAPDEFVAGVLSGYADGDGHTSVAGVTTITTVSPSLAWGVRLLAARLGVRATVRRTREQSEGAIAGRLVRLQPQYALSWRVERQNAGACIEHDGALFYSVMRKEHRTEEVNVYDMTVLEDHSYCTTGGVVHNCGTFPNGKHDDLVDTVSLALRHLRDIGMLERGMEVTAQLNDSLRYRGRPPSKLYPS